MVAAQELTVRQAARQAGRSEETLRRWIWSGRLPAVKRGTSYRIDVVNLERVMIELGDGSGQHATKTVSWEEWLAAVGKWKARVKATPGVSAADLVIEDRRARR